MTREEVYRRAAHEVGARCRHAWPTTYHGELVHVRRDAEVGPRLEGIDGVMGSYVHVFLWVPEHVAATVAADEGDPEGWTPADEVAP